MGFFQSISQKSWENPGVDEDLATQTISSVLPNAKIGLRLLLGVISVMFSLFAVAYYIRMAVPDWRTLADPQLLWFNTALLVLSSVAFQWARNASRQAQVKTLKNTLLMGGVFSIAFLAGQYTAWQQLIDAGFLVGSNPANAFFYLLTGLHAAHILAGLFVWAKTMVKAWAGAQEQVSESVFISVDLCTVYWHYLLMLWLALMALLLST